MWARHIMVAFTTNTKHCNTKLPFRKSTVVFYLPTYSSIAVHAAQKYLNVS